MWKKGRAYVYISYRSLIVIEISPGGIITIMIVTWNLFSLSVTELEASMVQQPGAGNVGGRG